MTEHTMRGSGRRWLGVFLGVAAAGLFAHLVLTTAAWAQGHAGVSVGIAAHNPGAISTGWSAGTAANRSQPAANCD